MSPTKLKVKSLRVGVLRFPGSNCDHDCAEALSRHFGVEVRFIWHEEQTLPPLDMVVIPGGFSFGDYLRSGALAAHSPIMAEVNEFTEKGGAVFGICNGFQILVEAKILPGMLLKNENLKFICKMVSITDSQGKILRMPIAHAEGRYFADEASLRYLEANGLIAYRYCGDDGVASMTSNPNGAARHIAGVYSKNRRVLGMMPHPERAADLLMGGTRDGLTVWEDFLERI